MICRLKELVLELEAKALMGADVWCQLNKLKQIIKELENVSVIQ